MKGAPQPGAVLCRLDELNDPGAKGFHLWTGEMMFHAFVVRRGETVQGWRDRCPHIGTPLTLGDDRYLTRDGQFIFCSTHGAMFRPDDGLCVGGPCAGQFLTPWAVELKDGAVVVAG